MFVLSCCYLPTIICCIHSENMAAVNHIQLVQNHSNSCLMDRIAISIAVGLVSIRCTKLKLDYRWKLIGPLGLTNATRQIMAGASSKPLIIILKFSGVW